MINYTYHKRPPASMGSHPAVLHAEKPKDVDISREELVTTTVGVVGKGSLRK